MTALGSIVVAFFVIGLILLAFAAGMYFEQNYDQNDRLKDS